MCLNIDFKIHAPRAHTAKKRITVFKVISRDDVSMVRSFRYSPHREYRCSMSIDHSARVHEGFHAFLRYGTAERVSRRGWGPMAGDWAKVVEFHIPKGAEYFIGLNGDVVSNKIVSGSLKPYRPPSKKRSAKK